MITTLEYKIPLLGTIIIALATVATTVLDSQTSLPGCPDHCGEMKIPYPFGTAHGCFLSEKFLIHCDQSFQPPKPFLGRSAGDIPVSSISLDGHELVIMVYVARDCYNKDGVRVNKSSPWLRLRNFNISTARNKFTAVGCDTYATIQGYRGEKQYTTGCLSSCNSVDGSFSNTSIESCSGVGCCQTSIPSGLKNFTVLVTSYYNHTYVYDFNPCSYASVTEESEFKFSPASFRELNNTETVPMVLNWDVGDESCVQAEKRANFTCKANSKCVDAIIGSGCRCQCLPGYQGNPYLPEGCQDIDECKISNPCVGSSICQNLPGNWTCICPQGYIATETAGCSKVCGSNQSQGLTVPKDYSISTILFSVCLFAITVIF